MKTPNRRIRVVLSLLVSIMCFASHLHASDDVAFYESFNESFAGRWIVSEKPDYTGVWEHEKSDGHDDYGLLVSQPARKYAIVKELDNNFNLNGRTTVLQFEVRLQNGLECGGAYLKFLQPQKAGWDPKDFDNESPYTIMFGPDKCGDTNKVRFILKHKNPKTGKFVEHHLKYPPSIPSDKLTHTYSAILNPDYKLKLLLDGEEFLKSFDILSEKDFTPPLIPPKTIPDPEDTKPEDWDEREKIHDPTAKKPEDWDEDAPMEIEDEEAVKPKGWLDDEPEKVDDPEATKPEDWDDEEDGEWQAPKIDNPKCQEAPGCGEWKRPMKNNPAYKGKWYAQLVDNPNYMGIWKPREIHNPEYFGLDKVGFEPIAAVGIEIWTMQDGILFDNILITSNVTVAKSYIDTQWRPKFELEDDKKQKELESSIRGELKGVKKLVFDYLYRVAELPFLGKHKEGVLGLIKKAEKQPKLTIGVLAALIVVVFTVLFTLIIGGKKPATSVKAVETKKADGAAEKSEKEEKNEDGSAAAAPPRRRNVRREDRG